MIACGQQRVRSVFSSVKGFLQKKTGLESSSYRAFLEGKHPQERLNEAFPLPSSVDARTMIFEDAQVEAWHETPDLSIDQGGAFFSGGPFNLTRSNLTAP